LAARQFVPAPRAGAARKLIQIAGRKLIHPAG
jgi:hypothetical protein